MKDKMLITRQQIYTLKEVVEEIRRMNYDGEKI